MKKITPQDIQKGVESVSASPESTYYITLDNLNNGDELCLAFGMGEGFDEPTVCAKIAVLASNSAMSDYEWDFVMPYEAKSGSVWDTEVSNPGESDAEWFNTQAAQIARKLNSGKLVASACGKKKGKKKPVQSMARGYLQPQHDSRASFYNKAEFDDDKLYSYGTLVAEIVDGKPVLYPDWDYSQTTIRHVREFLRQHGFTADSKAQIAKDYLTNSRRPIQSMYVTEDISGNDLYTRLWSGGKDQFDSMIEDGADPDDILNACEELLFREEGNPPTMTELNDLIWFEPDTIREYIGLSNPIESGCHGRSKKGKKKAVKSAAQISEIHNATSDCFVRITRSDVPEVGKVNDTIPLYEFKDNCRSYAETTNGSYYVTMDDTYEGEYFVEFSTGDTSFAPEDQRDDPYYNESLGTLQFEVIWNPGQELCNYLND